MKVFLDTNILLEVVLNREKKRSCQQLLQAGIEGGIFTCASFLSFANIAYILQKQKFPQSTSFLSVLCRFLHQTNLLLNLNPILNFFIN